MSDVYVILHVATTCDESSNYVSKDSTELIELAWSLVDGQTLEISDQDSILVKPVNTPITPYCNMLYHISWEHVREAEGFKAAIAKFDDFINEKIISQNKQFSFITTDVSKLRVQLPREARDKAVELPEYLQHPRVFDLFNEYSKWQTSHPETSPYTGNSVSNVISGLQVDVDMSEFVSSSPSNSSTPPPSAQEAPGPEIKTITSSKSTVNLYAKIMVQLIKKSLPIDEHLTVLTKPYDSAQDTRIFLAEKSKILYLSNLPHDTTQSELESWFTQYGGRPIAFWTLKNLDSLGANDPNKGKASASNKGISGFAVFSKHEEAAESLSMNGRVLNDFVVEVQASSTRVLDRANDLLTPFPSSKNRPRPGDWTCPSCGFSNFQRRTACFRCSFPAASAVAIQESMYTNNSASTAGNGVNNNSGGGNNNNNNRRHIKNGHNNHHNNNGSNNSQANAHALDKIALNAAVVNAAAAVLSSSNQFNQSYQDQNNQSLNQGHHNNHTNNHNNHNNGSRYGNNVPFRAGDWKCSNDSCQYHNFAKNLCCLKCGNAKPLNLGNGNNNNNSNSHNAGNNNNHSHLSGHHLHSVNSTAAAIAAATASGQPLNLSNSFSGLHQPQPHHAGQYNQSTNGGHSNMNYNHHHNHHNHHLQYQNQNRQNQSQNHNHGYGQNPLQSGGQPQMSLLPQQLAILQQQQLQSQQYNTSSNGSNYSQSATNSPGLYPSYGGQANEGYGKNSVSQSNGSGASSSSTPGDLNSSFNLLNNQINALSLNNH